MPKVVVPLPPPKVVPDTHTLFFDGAYRRGAKKARRGFVLLNSLDEVELEEAVVLAESMSNNEVYPLRGTKPYGQRGCLVGCHKSHEGLGL